MYISNFKKSFNILLISMIGLSYVLTSGILLFNPRVVKAATYTVTTNADSGAGSLRQAIIDANTNPGADIINFSIAGAGPHTISPASGYQVISEEVLIDGYSEPDATENSASAPSAFNGTIAIEIDATSATTTPFFINAANVTIRGLVINNAPNSAIFVQSGGDNAVIGGNYIGTNVTGSAAAGNTQAGIVVDAATGVRIGVDNSAPDNADRNLISGGDSQGILLQSAATGTNINGNYVGLAANGTSDLGNVSNGISLSGVNNNTIGNTSAATKNVISGNNGRGIDIADNSDNNIVQGNYIGTSSSGAAALGNTLDGIYLVINSNNNVIGGSVSDAGNVISGNVENGIQAGAVTADNNTIQGNYIGTNALGSATLPNTGDGITLSGTTGWTIGGDTSLERNVISGNGDDGVYLDNSDSNIVSGNYIGTSADGASDLGNSDDGIELSTNSSSNNIGGDTSLERNVISGNGEHGIVVGSAGATDNVVIGNYIGLNSAGDSNLGNAGDGIVTFNSAPAVTIGGINSGEGNVISGNGMHGVILAPTSDSSTIRGNIIGLNALGTVDIGNTGDGIQLDGTSSVTIGGASSAARNIISGNNSDGIECSNGGTSNIVQGNYIGTNISGSADVGNSFEGVSVANNTGAVLGGTNNGEGNVISGNNANGVYIHSSSTSTTVQGNLIGTDSTGMSDLGNTAIGIFSDQTATGTVVGGTTQSARNIVSGNDGSAISIGGYSTARGNYVGLNAAGSAAIPSATATATTPMINLNGTANIFGGTTVSARNYVVGGASFGILITGGTPFGGSSAIDNVVQGNCVGTNANCQRENGFGNAGIGIVAAIDALNTLIGGTETGAGNVVTGNGSGVAALGFSTFYPLNTSILGNSIYENGGGVASNIGIDNLQTNDFVTFVNQNVTPNDANDIDYAGTNTGPNHYMNFPVISAVTSTNGTATITYNLDINDAEVGATGYRVEFFANDSADASGHGEGQTYLGSDTVSGDVTGKQVTITLPANVSGTKYISAVTTMTDNSTDGFGHSSEFAADVEANLVAASNNSILAITGKNIRWLALLIAVLTLVGATGLYLSRRKQLFR